MRVVFMGTPEFAVAPLEHLILNKYRVAAVYTQPDKPAGRGRSLLPSPVKRAALARELPVVQPDNLKSQEVVAQEVKRLFWEGKKLKKMMNVHRFKQLRKGNDRLVE